jgi:hypothetical protein
LTVIPESCLIKGILRRQASAIIACHAILILFHQEVAMPTQAEYREAARKKLRQTRFFCGRLHDTHQRMGLGVSPEEFEYFLSAFLTSGRSVILIFEHIDNWQFFNAWESGLKTGGRQDDADLIASLRGERNKDVHRHGADLDIHMEMIPVTEIIAPRHSHPAYGIHWFGTPGTPPPNVGRPTYAFTGSGDEVLQTTDRYLALLDEFVTAYDAANP